MTPKITKPITQNAFVKSNLRLPPELHAAIKEAAVRNGRSLNAEVIARLQAAPQDAKLDAIAKTTNKIEKIVKELLDK